MCENKDRPDLELERLVMGDQANGARPKIGGVWVENPECPGAWRLEHEGKEQVLLAGVNWRGTK